MLPSWRRQSTTHYRKCPAWHHKEFPRSTHWEILQMLPSSQLTYHSAKRSRFLRRSVLSPSLLRWMSCLYLARLEQAQVFRLIWSGRLLGWFYRTQSSTSTLSHLLSGKLCLRPKSHWVIQIRSQARGLLHMMLLMFWKKSDCNT